MDFINEATPLYNAEAPTQGTGKTRVLRYATIPSQGCEISTLSPPDTEEEWNKTILTQLRHGAEYVLIDNLDTRLSSRSFANVLTSTEFQGRLLGTNTLGVYPNQITWAISVNNGSFNDDIARRTVLIRLDAGWLPRINATLASSSIAISPSGPWSTVPSSASVPDSLSPLDCGRHASEHDAVRLSTMGWSDERIAPVDRHVRIPG